MTDITIPPEVVEAAARAGYEDWRADGREQAPRLISLNRGLKTRSASMPVHPSLPLSMHGRRWVQTTHGVPVMDVSSSPLTQK